MISVTSAHANAPTRQTRQSSAVPSASVGVVRCSLYGLAGLVSPVLRAACWVLGSALLPPRSLSLCAIPMRASCFVLRARAARGYRGWENRKKCRMSHLEALGGVRSFLLAGLTGQGAGGRRQGERLRGRTD